MPEEGFNFFCRSESCETFGLPLTFFLKKKKGKTHLQASSFPRLASNFSIGGHWPHSSTFSVAELDPGGRDLAFSNLSRASLIEVEPIVEAGGEGCAAGGNGPAAAVAPVAAVAATETEASFAGEGDEMEEEATAGARGEPVAATVAPGAGMVLPRERRKRKKERDKKMKDRQIVSGISVTKEGKKRSSPFLPLDPLERLPRLGPPRLLPLHAPRVPR